MNLTQRWSRLRAAWRGGDDSPLSREEIRRIAQGVGRLSAGLTRDRALAGARYLDDPALLGAYLMFYWPRSYAQLGVVIPPEPGRVLDVGAGPLPLSWAAVDAGATSVMAIDREPRALALGRRLGDTPIAAQTWDAERGDALPDGPFDTIVMGHVLNELWLGKRAVERRVGFVESLLRRLAPGGRLVLLEPALRETSRALLEVRDQVKATIAAPCLVQTPCPALLRESDWCHAERAVEQPPELVQIAAEAKLHAERVKMSYLVLQNEPLAPVDEKLFRIVSEKLPQKGKTIVFGCGPRGRHPLVLADKDRAADNATFGELERGDLVEVEAVEPRGDGLRIRGGVRRI